MVDTIFYHVVYIKHKEREDFPYFYKMLGLRAPQIWGLNEYM